ncbi:MAG: hypothetical protein HUK15_00145 [Bacteroidales bacterium]|nr:hypothetical protein [Bacteroidales bacterium]
MTDLERKERDIRYLTQCLTRDLVLMQIEVYGKTIMQALDIVYSSKTYSKIENPKTGLYYQGAVYVNCLLQEELRGEW